MVERYTVIGTLSDQKTVILDEPVSLPTGRVRITVETLPTPNFWAGATVAELAEAQGVGAIEDLDDLKGDFGLMMRQLMISSKPCANGVMSMLVITKISAK